MRNRGTTDVCIVVCDGLKGLPDAINAVWPQALVQSCVLHLIRHTFRLASKAHWEALARDLRPIYTAVNETEAAVRLDVLEEIWGARCPGVIAMWRSAWPEFVPFLAFSIEVCKIVFSTNAVESLNARFRRATRARGHFPTEQAALKCLYLVVLTLP